MHRGWIDKRKLELKMKRKNFWQLLILSISPIVITFSTGIAWGLTFITVNDEAVIEAENYTRLAGSRGGSWFLNTAIAGYKGTGYLQSATDDPSTLNFSSDIISTQYDIDFRETGRYYLHLRTYAENHEQNGFFATVDGTQVDYGHPDATFIYVKQFESYPRWYWYTDGGGAEERGHIVSFNISSPGKKTLAIYRRDKSSRIDRIWVTKNQSAPRNFETLDHLPDPITFIPPEVCDDGLDNDQNGLTDCEDPACDSEERCNPENACDDGIDNDLDGFIDCLDDDCSSAAECACMVFDSDQDSIADCLDAFPQDPNEWQDTDSDGIGDNADEDDDNDSVPDAEEMGNNGDVQDYDGNSDGQADAKQKTVISGHSIEGTSYLTFSISDQGSFEQFDASAVTSAISPPPDEVFPYALFNLDINLIQNGSKTILTIYLPEGYTVDTVFLRGPTPDAPNDHWYSFDFDGETGVQIDGRIITMHFVDGRRGDYDLTSNGVVSAFIGPANLASADDNVQNDSTGNTDDPAADNSQSGNGGGGGGGGCFIGSLQ
jgi:hypothetical protein